MRVVERGGTSGCGLFPVGAVVLRSRWRRWCCTPGGARTGEGPDAGHVGGTGVRALRGPYLMDATASLAFDARSEERAADLASFAAAS